MFRLAVGLILLTGSLLLGAYLVMVLRRNGFRVTTVLSMALLVLGAVCVTISLVLLNNEGDANVFLWVGFGLCAVAGVVSCFKLWEYLGGCNNDDGDTTEGGKSASNGSSSANPLLIGKVKVEPLFGP